MNPVCEMAGFTHGKCIPYVKPRVLHTAPANMKSPYVKWPVLHTANESRMQNPVFYTRQMNLVCKTLCFTHGK